MAWTTPKTNWATGELVTAEDMNAVGENLAFLKSSRIAVGTTTAVLSTNATEFADVDSTNLNLTLTTTGGDVLVRFHGLILRANADGDVRAYFDVDVDGERQGGDGEIIQSLAGSNRRSVSIVHIIQNLSPGSHTFKLQWRRTARKSWYAVALEANAQFWVREI